MTGKYGQYKQSKPSNLFAAPSNDITSDTITVIGRRTNGSSTSSETGTDHSMLRPKRMRLAKSKLNTLQREESSRDERINKQTMTIAQQVDLQAFQLEMAGLDDNTSLNDINPSIGTNFEPADLHGKEDDDDEWVDIDESVVVEEMGLPTGSKAWANRLASEHQAWIEQLPALCHAYLSFCSGERAATHDGAQSISLLCVKIAAEATITFQHPPSELWTNVTLLHHGYLGSTPSAPNIAFSLELLDLLAAVQRRGPAVSMQIMAKAFCDLRNVPYYRRLG